MAEIDTTDLYRRADIERRIARGVMDGLTEKELAEVIGLPSREVGSIVGLLTARIQGEANEIARIHAIKQTGQLSALYLSAEEEWDKTKDPRYAEQMRGSLSDIRKIWGVEAPQRIALGGSLNMKGGVLGGILGGLDDRTLNALADIFDGSNAGAGTDGEGVPAT